MNVMGIEEKNMIAVVVVVIIIFIVILPILLLFNFKYSVLFSTILFLTVAQVTLT